MWCEDIKMVKNEEYWNLQARIKFLMYCSFFFHILLSRKKNHFAHIPELEIIIFFNFILFLNLKHCISFAKHQNESATGIHVHLVGNI